MGKAHRRKVEPEPGKLRKFRVTFGVTVELEVSDDLLKSCNTDEWRATMMQFTNDKQFVEHIAYNVAKNGCTKLAQIDGYADQPEERLRIIDDGDWDWGLNVEEVT